MFDQKEIQTDLQFSMQLGEEILKILLIRNEMSQREIE